MTSSGTIYVMHSEEKFLSVSKLNYIQLDIFLLWHSDNTYRHVATLAFSTITQGIPVLHTETDQLGYTSKPRGSNPTT